MSQPIKWNRIEGTTCYLDVIGEGRKLGVKRSEEENGEGKLDFFYLD